MNDFSGSPVEIRIDPMVRRVAWGGVGWFLLGVVMALWAWHDGEWGIARPKELTGIMMLLVAFMLFVATIAARWRLRIDEHGLHRRRLFRWHLWPWEDFREGRVRHHRSSHNLINSAQPLRRRFLTLNPLTVEDQRLLMEVVTDMGEGSPSED